jgi:hypothetical protein
VRVLAVVDAVAKCEYSTVDIVTNDETIICGHRWTVEESLADNTRANEGFRLCLRGTTWDSRTPMPRSPRAAVKRILALSSSLEWCEITTVVGSGIYRRGLGKERGLDCKSLALRASLTRSTVWLSWDSGRMENMRAQLVEAVALEHGEY